MAIAAIALLYVESQAALRRRALLENLQRSNSLLVGARVAQEVERHIQARAAECFHSEYLRRLIAAVLAETATESALDVALARCSLAEDFFIVRGDAVEPFSRSSLRANAVAAKLREVNLPPVSLMFRGIVYPLAMAGSPPVQLMYTLPAHLGEESVVVALSVRTAWVRDALAAARHRLNAPLSLQLKEQHKASSSDLLVKFGNILPFWVLSVVPAEAAVLEGSELFLPVSATAIVLLVLAATLAIWAGMKQTQVAELRSSFINGVSHDLRAPVAAIRLYAELLSKEEKFRVEDRQQFYRVILNESDRLARMVDRLLGFSLLQRHEFAFDMRRGDLSATVRETLTRFEPFAGYLGFAIHLNIDTSLPEVVFDADAVSEALLNLLDNALKYSGSARDISVSVYRMGDEIAVAVRDRGIGMTEEEASRVFEEYYRSQRVRSTGGYGLGLYVAHAMMKAHGGSIKVQSQVGTGSEFILLFPIPQGDPGRRS